ncbi:MAG TPA: translation elongation factor Ts [Verrucomicrobiales bacterium]|nr:translation elongation factor Ts [Verrucomicrobiales bacterium]HIL70085.1 translation elongation factor Ts [Verrucomicrobiota bacterium]
MAQINAAEVGKLRKMTGAGLMDCKKALSEAEGNLDAAVDVLRKKGIASAAKKASRDANEGVVAQYISPGADTGVLVEINCETDFVAKNEDFLRFCEEVAKKIAEDPDQDLEEFRTSRVAKMGENIVIARHEVLKIKGSGMVAAYIHTGGKVGVLVEVGAGKSSTVEFDEFKQLVRDITLQIAAAYPVAVSRDQLDPAVVAKEKEIAAEQFKDKPAQAIEKIVNGKLEKFYQNTCLLDQGFVKRNGDISMKDHMLEVAKPLEDEISVCRFVRFQVGES